MNGRCACIEVQKTAQVPALGVTELSSSQRMTSALLESEPLTWVFSITATIPKTNTNAILLVNVNGIKERL